jgi:hypothetical protein
LQQSLPAANAADVETRATFGARTRNVYSILRPFLCPKDDVYAHLDMVQVVWTILLDDQDLWIDHRQLVGLVMEMMQSNTDYVPSGTQMETWKVWRYLRQEYVKACLAHHERTTLRPPSDDGDSSATAVWCSDPGCNACWRVSNEQQMDPDVFRAMLIEPFIRTAERGRRMSEIFGKRLDTVEDYIEELDGHDRDPELYSPFYDIPPRPCEAEVDHWRYCEVREKNYYSRRRAWRLMETELIVPKVSYMTPDLQVPTHFLFYLLACDPRVCESDRLGIMAGLRGTTAMQRLSPVPNPTRGCASTAFGEGCRQMHQYAQSVVRPAMNSADYDLVAALRQKQRAESADKQQCSTPVSLRRSQSENCRIAEAYTLGDFSQWCSDGFPAHDARTMIRSAFPVQMLIQVAVSVEALSNLPYDHDLQRAAALQCHSEHARYGENMLRSHLSFSTMRQLYDPVELVMVAAFASRQPLGYRARHAPLPECINNLTCPEVASPACRIPPSQVQYVYDTDCMPLWLSPITTVENYNNCGHGQHSDMLTDNVVNGSFFDRASQVPLPFSLAKAYVVHESINHPVQLLDGATLDTMRRMHELEPGVKFQGQFHRHNFTVSSRKRAADGELQRVLKRLQQVDGGAPMEVEDHFSDAPAAEPTSFVL